MVWCLVENTTLGSVKVATYNAGDFLVQTVAAHQYTLAAGETRLVTSSALIFNHLYVRLDGRKASFKVHLGRQLRISSDPNGVLTTCELRHLDMTTLRVPILSQRGPSEDSATQLLQAGDQICTRATTLPFKEVMHHGVVLSCTKSSIQVVHFQDTGVRLDELFGQFTSGQVYLVDYWGESGKGLIPAIAPDATVKRLQNVLDHPNQRLRYNVETFNCEHWATKMKQEDPNADGFSRQLYVFKEGSYMLDRLGALGLAAGITNVAGPIRG